MKFAQLLREYIGQRTLEQMAALCAEKGLNLDPTYISKLRTGNRPAPDDERVVRVLAEACGRDPEPLLLLAKYERNPHEVMQEIVEAFVFAIKCAEEIQRRIQASMTTLVARLEAGESIPPAELISALSEDPVIERIREAYDRYRDRAFEIIDLITDWNRVPTEAAYGERGSFERVPYLPDGLDAALRPEENVTRVSRMRALVVRLSELAGVPEDPIIAAIVAAKAIKDPDFDAADFVRTHLRP